MERTTHGDGTNERSLGRLFLVSLWSSVSVSASLCWDGVRGLWTLWGGGKEAAREEMRLKDKRVERERGWPDCLLSCSGLRGSGRRGNGGWGRLPSVVSLSGDSAGAVRGRAARSGWAAGRRRGGRTQPFQVGVGSTLRATFRECLNENEQNTTQDSSSLSLSLIVLHLSFSVIRLNG